MIREDVITDDPWFETKSETSSARNEVNIHFEELLTNLLDLRGKWCWSLRDKFAHWIEV
jgi:hypothetical protein